MDVCKWLVRPENVETRARSRRSRSKQMAHYRSTNRIRKWKCQVFLNMVVNANLKTRGLWVKHRL